MRGHAAFRRDKARCSSPAWSGAKGRDVSAGTRPAFSPSATPEACPRATMRATFPEVVMPLLRQRVRPHLDMHRHRARTLAEFVEPRCAVAARAPQSASLPAGVRIVDAGVE